MKTNLEYIIPYKNLANYFINYCFFPFNSPSIQPQSMYPLRSVEIFLPGVWSKIRVGVRRARIERCPRGEFRSMFATCLAGGQGGWKEAVIIGATESSSGSTEELRLWRQARLPPPCWTHAAPPLTLLIIDTCLWAWIMSLDDWISVYSTTSFLVFCRLLSGLFGDSMPRRLSLGHGSFMEWFHEGLAQRN